MFLIFTGKMVPWCSLAGYYSTATAVYQVGGNLGQNPFCEMRHYAIPGTSCTFNPICVLHFDSMFCGVRDFFFMEIGSLGCGMHRVPGVGKTWHTRSVSACVGLRLPIHNTQALLNWSSQSSSREFATRHPVYFKTFERRLIEATIPAH